MRLLLSSLTALAALTAPAFAQDWDVDTEASTLGFEVPNSVSGQFGQFDAEITLDPANLDTAMIDAVVRPGSFDGVSDSSARNALSGSDGFAPDDYPEARFVSTDIRATGDGYEAVGELTLKGQTSPLTLPFTLEINDGRAIADGAFSLDRTIFGIGTSDWNVSSTVRIVLHIEADAIAAGDAATDDANADATE